MIIQGKAGNLEAAFHKGENKKAILLLHPHPLYGGTMHNRVVFSLYRVFKENGFSVLRINYRGVGNSEGSFGEGIGETEDAKSALMWLKENHQFEEIWLGGFSFGTFVSLNLIFQTPEINRFVLVCPPYGGYNWIFPKSLMQQNPKGYVIQSKDDDIVSPQGAHELAKMLNSKYSIDMKFHLTQGDHFFQEHRDELEKAIQEAIAYLD